MKLTIIDFEETPNGKSVALTLSNNQEIVVGNEVINRTLKKCRMDSFAMEMLMPYGVWQLRTDGEITAHKAGDPYYNSDGAVVGNHKYDGFSISYKEGAVRTRPSVKFVSTSIEVSEFASNLAKGYKPIGNDDTSSPLQSIPTSAPAQAETVVVDESTGEITEATVVEETAPVAETVS